ncbi:hypothetical protein DCBHLPFO_00641 [Mycoplasmopsis arginini]|uniref:Uncharacterized protein n=1 Tax=Mycoplasmopsis arginini TaxID=2094 RepID=A0AA43R085_MYCAR|nr:hypothetical protein [Mycoplasmopsis arginini]
MFINGNHSIRAITNLIMKFCTLILIVIIKEIIAKPVSNIKPKASIRIKNFTAGLSDLKKSPKATIPIGTNMIVEIILVNCHMQVLIIIEDIIIGLGTSLLRRNQYVAKSPPIDLGVNVWTIKPITVPVYTSFHLTWPPCNFINFLNTHAWIIDVAQKLKHINAKALLTKYPSLSGRTLPAISKRV